MPHVLIAGAGIGGLAAALTLAKAGATVTVLERSPRLGEVGAGLQLSPNATRILDGLGLGGAVAAASVRPSGVRVRAARSGRTLSVMPLAGAEQRWGSAYCVLRRADLQAILVAAVRADPSIALSLGTTLAGFAAGTAGVAVTVKADRVTRGLEGDALIGADGVRSTVRAKLATGGDAPRETGRTAWRSLVDSKRIDPQLRTDETSLWLGRDAHLVHYPLRDGRINVVAVTRDSAAATPDDLWSSPGDASRIASRFAGWHRLARDLIAAADGWSTWPLFDRDPLPAWNAGPIALLGDAAHPILPFLAQGAAQAIEDAGALAASVASTRSMPDALAAYSRTRQPRATRVQETSRQLGRIYHLAGPMAVARDASMRLIGPQRLLARYDWLYGSPSSERDSAGADSLRLVR